MDTAKRLAEIWSEDYIGTLPAPVKERGYWFVDNIQKEILITGINPSYREGKPIGPLPCPIEDIWKNKKHDNYWSPIIKMLNDGEIDLRNKADYLDIFYFREQDQRLLNDKILSSPNGVRFVADQLNLTMHIIEEVVKPKLIIIKNKESWAYFGKLFKEKGWVWMGYQFEHILNLECGELCRIKGLLESQERIAPEIKQTNLIGTFALFTKHINQYTALQERPKAQTIELILNWYKAEELVRGLAI